VHQPNLVSTMMPKASSLSIVAGGLVTKYKRRNR